MAVFDKIKKDKVFLYGSENAVASFYKWLSDLFDHPEGYSLILDAELNDPEARRTLPFPCIVLTQIDTTDNATGFIGLERDRNNCLFKISCLTNRALGGIRLLRRMKDQIIFALKRAGIYSEVDNDLIIKPISILDFTENPPTELETTLTLSNNITQHFVDDGDVMEYELMVVFNYIIDGKKLGA